MSMRILRVMPKVISNFVFMSITCIPAILQAKDTIPVRKHELQRESHHVDQDTIYKCGNKKIRLVAVFSQNTPPVKSISINGKRIKSTLVTEINNYIIKQDSFDFSFVTCSSLDTQIHFQKIREGQESEIYSFVLQ